PRLPRPARGRRVRLMDLRAVTERQDRPGNWLSLPISGRKLRCLRITHRLGRMQRAGDVNHQLVAEGAYTASGRECQGPGRQTMIKILRTSCAPLRRDPDPGEQSSCCRQPFIRSEEHTSELQSRENLVCRLLLEKKKKK